MFVFSTSLSVPRFRNGVLSSFFFSLIVGTSCFVQGNEISLPSVSATDLKDAGQADQEKEDKEAKDALTEAANKTSALWDELQQHLSLPSPSMSKVAALRSQYEAQRNNELTLFNQLVERLSEQEYQSFLKPQVIENTSQVECQRLETETQCIERATKLGIEQVAKQGASYYVQARSHQTSSRTESNDSLNVEQTFSEDVDMIANAQVLKFVVLNKNIVANNVTSEKAALVELKAWVSGDKNTAYLAQLRKQYSAKLASALSSPLQAHQKTKSIVVSASKGDFTIHLVHVPGGRFELGSHKGDKVETPILNKRVQPFYLANTEVTNQLYDLCIREFKCSALNGAKASKDDRAGIATKEQPVVSVSWSQIQQQFLPWLRQKTGEEFRLPNEIEWEYVAKFDEPNMAHVCLLGNIDLNECKLQKQNKGPVTVASYKANSLGVFDLVGNVAEWTNSCWRNRHQETDLTASSKCSKAVIKGGSWYQGVYHSRPAARGSRNVNDKLDTLGFRLALDF